MNTENVLKNLRVLWRTDRIIADIRMRHLLVGLGLRAFAALIATFGLDALQLEARALQSQLSGMIQHPLNGILPLLIVPLLTIIIKSLKKSRATATPAVAAMTEQT